MAAGFLRGNLGVTETQRGAPVSLDDPFPPSTDRLPLLYVLLAVEPELLDLNHDWAISGCLWDMPWLALWEGNAAAGTALFRLLMRC